MNPLLTQFISEARDLLEQGANGLLALESCPGDGERVDEVFRAAHTLKGTSGLFEFRAITDVVHAAEDVLDCVRQGNLVLTSALTDSFLDSFDQVGNWIDAIEQHGALPDEAAEVARQLAANLRTALQRTDAPTAAKVDDRSEDEAACEWLAQLTADECETALQCIATGTTVLALTYEPDDQCFFNGDDPLQTVRQIPHLLALRIENREPCPPLAELDYYRCTLRFQVLTATLREELAELFRYVPEQIRISKVTAATLKRQPLEAVMGTNVEASHRALLLDILQQQAYILGLPCQSAQWSSRLASVARTLKNLGAKAENAVRLSALEVVVEEAKTTQSYAPVTALIAEWQRSITTSSASSQTARTELPKAPSGDAETMNATAGTSRAIKVDPTKIDQLVDLVGELVVAKNALPYLARRADKDFGLRELSREIKEQSAVIHRITEALYESVMQVRMLPVSAIFQRFPRLVRDLSHKLGKQIKLVVEGEETEADKTVIERLSDPLIHLVRNSIDHGIELPEVRLAAGKPSEGRASLRAFHEGDRVVIEVADDGRGLDPQRIKQKAYERGLIDEAKLETISDQEAIYLILRPGFSTADQVTDLSGRGVGMDVVHRAVTAAGGVVTLESRLGEGTRVRLSLPLTMAVSRVLVVGEGRDSYGVPMETVVETLRVPRAAFRQIKQEEVVVWRDRLIPVQRLKHLLALADANQTPQLREEEAVLVVRQGNDDIGIIVESFQERVDTIVKPLESLMAGCVGFSGSAILGDGRVLLILNFKELL